MSELKATPGPWAVRYDYVVQAPSFDDGRLVPVAQPYGVNSDGTDLFANSRLIAAAPDMYQELLEIRDWMSSYNVTGKYDAEIYRIDNVLSKARGEDIQ